MKKSLVARGITGIVASLLGVAAVGCSAEPGDYADVETTSQAVTLTPTLPAGALGVMSCSVHDATLNKDYVLFLGGVDSTTNAALNTIDAMDTSNNTLVGKGAGQPLNGKTITARGFGRTIEVGNDCYALGGTTKTDNRAAALTAVTKVHVANNVWTLTALNMNVARNDFSIEKCGASKYIIVGGQDFGTYLDSIEVFDPSGASFANVAGTLSDQKSAMEFAALDSNFDKFVAAGGEINGGLSSKIDVITVSASTCNANQVTVAELVDADNSPAKLTLGTNRAYGVALVHDRASVGAGHKDQFALAAGYNTGLIATVNNLEIANWATPSGRFATNLSNINVSTAHPEVVYSGTTPFLIGGANNPLYASATSSVSAVQSYTGLNGSDTWTTTAGATALLTARYIPSATFATSNSKFYSAGGVLISAGPPVIKTFQTSIESW